MPRRSTRADNIRRLVAHEAARLMSEQGIDDFYLAKRKAAERLGVSDKSGLPRNSEIEAALVENQRIFSAEKHKRRLRDYRREACSAMQQFEEFHPRVVGGVINGAVSQESDLELHFFSDTPELVTLRFIDAGIPYRLVDRRVKTSGNGYQRVPGFRFYADEVPVLVLVFPRDGIRQAPLSPVDGKPMRRADRSELESLVSAVQLTQ